MSRVPGPLLLLLALAASPAAPAVRAEGTPATASKKGGEFPAVVEAKDDEAKRMLADLEKALQSKDENSATMALRPMVTKKHPDLVPKLKDLLDDRRKAVAALAAEALGSQGDKSASPLLMKVLAEKPTKEEKKKGFLLRGAVKAACIESLGRLGDARAYGEVRDQAEDVCGKDAERTYATSILRAAVRYFGLLKQKEAVKFLIDLVDQPVPADPNSATNPGAEYWKARHDTWIEVLPEVVWALKEITGKELESGRRWKQWFEEEGKKAGMK